MVLSGHVHNSPFYAEGSSGSTCHRSATWSLVWKRQKSGWPADDGIIDLTAMTRRVAFGRGLLNPDLLGPRIVDSRAAGCLSRLEDGWCMRVSRTSMDHVQVIVPTSELLLHVHRRYVLSRHRDCARQFCQEMQARRLGVARGTPWPVRDDVKARRPHGMDRGCMGRQKRRRSPNIAPGSDAEATVTPSLTTSTVPFDENVKKSSPIALGEDGLPTAKCLTG